MKPYPKYLDWLRYLCADLLFTYGLSKIAGVQFTSSPDIARQAIGTLIGYQLTWYYYGYSQIYASLLGLTQLFGASPLLFQKTALLGAAIMTPVMANLIINLFFHIAPGCRVCGGVHLWVHAGTAVAGTRRLLGLFLGQQASEPANSRGFHRYI
ncbi:MAG: hypothetical protein WBX22_16635 [Silvibacterium sp.]|jgi:hypothetical protein